MPEQVRCPDCDATLRVPDNLLGHKVKCPKCQTTFTAEVKGSAEAIVEAPSRGVTRRPSLPPEEMEEELPPEEEEDEDRPRRGRGRRYSKGMAESMVAGPAIAMMVVAGLDIALHIFDILLRLFGVGLIAAMGPKGAQPGQQAEMAVGAGINITSDVVAMSLAVLILVGAMKMKNLSGYGLAMTACIISILPCHGCCCLGIPFGIWGLVVLSKPEVKEAFSS
jgi:predicted Zn finger-like uncharacterized protein